MLSQVKNVYKLYNNVVIIRNSIGSSISQRHYSIKKHQGERDRIMKEKQENVEISNLEQSIKDTYDPTSFRQQYPELYNISESGNVVNPTEKKKGQYPLPGAFAIFQNEQEADQNEMDDPKDREILEEDRGLIEAMTRDKKQEREIKLILKRGSPLQRDLYDGVNNQDIEELKKIGVSEQELIDILDKNELNELDDEFDDDFDDFDEYDEYDEGGVEEEDDDEDYKGKPNKFNEDFLDSDMRDKSGLKFKEDKSLDPEYVEENEDDENMDEDELIAREEERNQLKEEEEPEMDYSEEEDDYEVLDREEAYSRGEEYDNEVDLYPGLPVIRPKKKPFQEFTKYGLYNPNNIFAEGLIDLFRDPEQYIKRYTERYNIQYKDYISSIVKDLEREEYYTTVTLLAEYMNTIASKTSPFENEVDQVEAKKGQVNWEDIKISQEDKENTKKVFSSIDKCVAHLNTDFKILRTIDLKNMEFGTEISPKNLFFYRNIKKALDVFYSNLESQGIFFSDYQKTARLGIEFEKFATHQQQQQAIKFNEKKPLDKFIPQLLDKSFVEKLKVELKSKGDFTPLSKEDQFLAYKDLKQILKAQKPRDTKLEMNPIDKFVDPSPILVFFNSLGSPAIARRRLSKLIRLLLKINRTPTAASLLTSEEKDILARRWPNSFMSTEELYDESTDIEGVTDVREKLFNLGENIEELKDFNNLQNKTDANVLAEYYIENMVNKADEDYVREEEEEEEEEDEDEDEDEEEEDEDDEESTEVFDTSKIQKWFLDKYSSKRLTIDNDGIFVGDTTQEILLSGLGKVSWRELMKDISAIKGREMDPNKLLIKGKPLTLKDQRPYFDSKFQHIIKTLKKAGLSKSDIARMIQTLTEKYDRLCDEEMIWGENIKDSQLFDIEGKDYFDLIEETDEKIDYPDIFDEKILLNPDNDDLTSFLGQFEHIYPDLFDEQEELEFNENAYIFAEKLGENLSTVAMEPYLEAKEIFLDHAETYFEDIEDDLDDIPMKRISRLTKQQQEIEEKLMGKRNQKVDEENFDRELGENEIDEEEFDTRGKVTRSSDILKNFIVLDVARHTKVTKAGRVQSFSALVFGTDGNGTGAMGYGKGDTAPSALRRSITDCLKRPFTLDLYNGTTLPSGLDIKYRSTKIRFFKTSRPDELNTRSHKQSLLLPMLGIYGTGFRTYGRRGWKNILETISRELPNFNNPQEIAKLLGKKYVNSANLYKKKAKPDEMTPLSELLQDKLENQVHQDQYDVDVLSQFLYDLDKKPRKRPQHEINTDQLKAVYEKYYGNEDRLNTERFKTDVPNYQFETSQRRIDPMFTGTSKRKFERNSAKTN